MGGGEVGLEMLYKGGTNTLHESSKRPTKERDGA